MKSDEKTNKKYKTNIRNIVRNYIHIFLRKLYNRFPYSFRHSHYLDSLLKYDKRAGTYVEIYNKTFDSSFVRDVIIDGERKEAPFGDAYHKHLKWLAQEIIRPHLKGYGSLMEVGAGELTTLVPVAQHLNDPTVEIHASELSWSRCYVGRTFAASNQVAISTLATGSVTKLPYATNSIDIVYTHYCLEELSGFQKQALSELMRVARSYVFLIEASYELGLPAQRRKLRNRHWNMELVSSIKKLGFKLVHHELIPNCTDALHHGALFILQKDPQSTDAPRTGPNVFACPICKAALTTDGIVYMCKTCQRVFPILDGIPVFTMDNAIIASLYMAEDRVSPIETRE